ncbi:hypothetical protein [Lentzea sp. NPDC004782]|uniref:hypothetical protein n=1 Tax=Lentzea sp. NPDC004782 TaxID=3154458 RepID=UPI0033ADE0E4
MSTLDDPASRARFRWLLGHHVAFCVWRRLAEVLARMVTAGVTDEGLEESAWWYDRYTSTVLYAGSCGEPLYRNVIRPDMAALHPSFSGLWARDHTWVRWLLGQLPIPRDSPLKSAVRRNRAVHMAVGQILVPEGGSLFKESGGRARCGATADEERLFDSYFLVYRTTVTQEEFRTHALLRVAAVLCDLAARPIDLPGYAEVGAALPDDIVTMMQDTAAGFAGAPGSKLNA